MVANYWHCPPKLHVFKMFHCGTFIFFYFLSLSLLNSLNLQLCYNNYFYSEHGRRGPRPPFRHHGPQPFPPFGPGGPHGPRMPPGGPMPRPPGPMMMGPPGPHPRGPLGPMMRGHMPGPHGPHGPVGMPGPMRPRFPPGELDGPHPWNDRGRVRRPMKQQLHRQPSKEGLKQKKNITSDKTK